MISDSALGISAPAVGIEDAIVKCRCHKCRRDNTFRRINRRGWLERELLSRWLGYYPWECVECRSPRFLRRSGEKAHLNPWEQGVG